MGRAKVYPNRTIGRLWRNLKARCETGKDPKAKYYLGRGIKNELTLNDIKSLWDRDKAEHMRQPSLDRINGDNNYTLENCRFVEMRENRRGPQRWFQHNYKKIRCKFCRRWCEQKRQWQQFCSDACRSDHWQAHHPHSMPPEPEAK